MSGLALGFTSKSGLPVWIRGSPAPFSLRGPEIWEGKSPGILSRGCSLGRTMSLKECSPCLAGGHSNDLEPRLFLTGKSLNAITPSGTKQEELRSQKGGWACANTEAKIILIIQELWNAKDRNTWGWETGVEWAFLGASGRHLLRPQFWFQAPSFQNYDRPHCCHV